MLSSSSNGCIRVFVDWEAWQPEEIIELTSRVTNSGFTINNQTVSVSTRPCTTSDGRSGMPCSKKRNITTALKHCLICFNSLAIGLLLAGTFPVAPTGSTLTPHNSYTNHCKASGKVCKRSATILSGPCKVSHFLFLMERDTTPGEVQ